MASPFLEDPVELGARIVRGSLRRARVFRDRQNPLAFLDDFLYERYRFSSEGTKLPTSRALCGTRRSRALTVPQTVCIALRFFASGSFMYAVGDAENMSKNTFFHMTCDHQCMVTSIDAKWPGSVHDSRIFRESTLCQNAFCDTDHGNIQSILRDVQWSDAVDRGTAFNVTLTRTRVRIEMTFGILKASFSCLRGLRAAPGRACIIIAACVVLHNVATARRKMTPPVNPQPPDVVDPTTLDHPTGRAVREAITQPFFS
ncbi:LOW QUALITY PROTEIN: putative nuclease HARBI1 [Tautogolabrus adspersus]